MDYNEINNMEVGNYYAFYYDNGTILHAKLIHDKYMSVCTDGVERPHKMFLYKGQKGPTKFYLPDSFLNLMNIEEIDYIYSIDDLYKKR